MQRSRFMVARTLCLGTVKKLKSQVWKILLNQANLKRLSNNLLSDKKNRKKSYLLEKQKKRKKSFFIFL